MFQLLPGCFLHNFLSLVPDFYLVSVIEIMQSQSVQSLLSVTTVFRRLVIVVRDSLLCRASVYPPCAGLVISRPCAFRSRCVVCVKAESLFFDIVRFLPSRC